ncbi:Multidrug resistance protein MdtC [Candidatus Hepatincola sp. Pdp]
MTLPELGIKRWVMSFMVGFGIIIFGAVCFLRVGVDEFPDIDFPMILVTTTETGSDPEIIDSTVTSVLVENINGIAGIDTLTATSYPGLSSVFIKFELDKDVDAAFQEVQAKINQAKQDLPDDIDEPEIVKRTSSDTPIVLMTLSGNRILQQLNVYADDIIKKRLETIDGASEVVIDGELDRKARIEVDVFKLASYGIALNQFVSTIQKSHILMPGGYVVARNKEYLVKLDLEFHDPKKMMDIVIKNNGGSLVKLKDVAVAYDGLDDFRAYSDYMTNPALSIGVTKIVGASTYSIEKEILKRLNEDLLPALEPGLKVKVIYDQVDYIKAIVDGLEEHLILGTMLTSLVVYLFLRSFISTIIVAFAIPISLLGSVIVIYSFGYTFNTITLLGLLLLIGIVVDDAIIILENIYRKMEEGEDPTTAAINGSNQIVFAVLAATLSLVCIFGPVMFMGGIIGKFFKSFAVTVTFGVLISYFVALFITPMLCARYLRASQGDENFFKRMLESAFVALEKGYVAILKWALKTRLIMSLLAVLLILSISLLMPMIPVEFIADSNEGLFSVNLKTPSGSNIYYTIEKLQEVAEILKKEPNVKDYNGNVGTASANVNRAVMTVRMVDFDKRTMTQPEFIRYLQKKLDKMLGVIAIASAPSVGGGAYKLMFVIVGPDMHVLYKLSTDIGAQLSANPKLGQVDLGMEVLPKLRFEPDRNKIAVLGLTPQDVVHSIAIAVGGVDIAKFNHEEGSDTDRYDVRVKATDSQFTDKGDIKNIYLVAGDNSLVRLDNVVKIKSFLGLATVDRFGSLFSAAFNLNPVVATGDAMKEIAKATAHLPPGYKVEYLGGTKELIKTIGYIKLVFSLAVVLLYMVLASQFNSFVQPIVLMMAVPLAMVGGLIALLITGFSLNMFSMIGLILLVGLVAKNSILLIDFTNELRAKGKSINDALLEACPIRLRPILMTSLTVILTMLPSAISRGEGAENNASLSIMVIGGMVSSTFLTLLVIPVFYSWVEELLAKRNKNNPKDPNLLTTDAGTLGNLNNESDDGTVERLTELDKEKLLEAANLEDELSHIEDELSQHLEADSRASRRLFNRNKKPFNRKK